MSSLEFIKTQTQTHICCYYEVMCLHTMCYLCYSLKSTTDMSFRTAEIVMLLLFYSPSVQLSQLLISC